MFWEKKILVFWGTNTMILIEAGLGGFGGTYLWRPEINPHKIAFLLTMALSIFAIAMVRVSNNFLKEFNGWLETYNPSNSFSQVNFSKSLAGTAGSILISVVLMAAGAEANNPIWLLFLFFWFSRAISNNFSKFCRSWFLSAKASKAPALIKASMDFLFKSLVLTRLTKSPMEENGPPFLISSVVESIIPTPTFLMANNPNRIFCWPGTTVKFFSDSLILGGKTSMSIFLHSSINKAIRSTSAFSEVKTEAINSTG